MCCVVFSVKYRVKITQPKDRKEYFRLYRLKNNRSDYFKAYRESHPDYGKKWREARIEEQRAYEASYREQNREKFRLWQKNFRERNKDNLEYRLSKSLRQRLRSAIKGVTKGSSAMILVGCTIEKLKKHLESQFQFGMTWGNYGQWHIDHIKPCASFNLSDPAQQIKCFHYSNLQPLWAKENISKGKKLLTLTEESSIL